MLSDIRFRMRALFRRNALERELDEELRFHYEHQVEAYRKVGHPPEEARRRARLEFGLDQVKEECRDARGVRWLDESLQDLRYAARTLGKNPGFTAVAALSLALGIGANSAIFAVLDAFLFRPSPLSRNGRFISIATRNDKISGRPISYPNFLDWQRQNQVFERMAAYRISAAVLVDGAGAERVPLLQVSAGFFPLVGVRPALGRDFRPEEHRPGGGAVALLSYELWQRRYNGDPALLGKALLLRGYGPVTAVGVTPRGFRIGPRADLYVSLDRTAARESRASANSLYGLGLLKPGVTLEQARAQMNLIARALEEQYPQANRGWRIDLIPFGRLRNEELRAPLFLLMGAVGFVLLIACANLSNLLLARAAGRGREVAIRKSLGATRGRLVRQMLAESLLLAALGGAAGALFAYWGCQGLLQLVGDLDQWPGGEPLGGIGIDLRVLGFTAAAAILAGVAAGLAPAFRASGRDLTAELKQSGPAAGGRKQERRWRDTLVTLESALALVLLAGGGLMMRSLYHLMSADPGFEPRRVLTLSLESATLARNSTAERKDADELGRRLVEEIEALPGVEAAAPAFPAPFGHGFSGNTFYAEGRPPADDGRLPEARMHYVGPHYGRAMGLRLRAGRWFAAAETGRAAVVNERMARLAWPGENPIGRRFSLGGAKPPWITVVGVAADTRENGLHSDPGPEIYMPISFSADMLVRTAGDPAAMAAVIRNRIRGVDKSLAVYDVAPLAVRMSDSLLEDRIFAWLLGIFAAAALCLAAVGIYGVIAHAAGKRTREVGLRVALGARSSDVALLILRQGMAPALAGIVLGAAGAWGATRALASFLHGVTPTDPLTFAAVTLLLTAVALAACWIPARRAMRVDPAVALRYE